MLKKWLSVLILSSIFSVCLDGQVVCAACEYDGLTKSIFPELQSFNTLQISQELPADQVITIPIIFHVLYNQEEENILEAQIDNQLVILNRVFSDSYANAELVPSIFRSVKYQNTYIKFRKAWTNRRQTQMEEFIINLQSDSTSDRRIKEPIKFYDQGGADVEQPNEYLNVWIGKIFGVTGTDETGSIPLDIKGYSSFPGWPRALDGIVIDYRAFGNTGTAQAPYHKGLTLVHEIGHWLGLHHLYGRIENCESDDQISDTPAQSGPITDCPGNWISGCLEEYAMHMNFLSLTNDECRLMYTKEQVTQMRKQFAAEGFRADFVKAPILWLAEADSSPSSSQIRDPSIIKVQRYGPVLKVTDSKKKKPNNQKIKFQWKEEKGAIAYEIETTKFFHERATTKEHILKKNQFKIRLEDSIRTLSIRIRSIFPDSIRSFYGAPTFITSD